MGDVKLNWFQKVLGLIASPVIKAIQSKSPDKYRREGERIRKFNERITKGR